MTAANKQSSPEPRALQKHVLQAECFDAAIFDLDGVVTRTARVHARSWKQLFDDFLRRRSAATGEPFRAFDISSDYQRYVDGKLRFDGVADFLKSRSIDLPRGDPADAPERETIYGLGNRKNGYFRQHLAEEGVEVFDPAVRFVRTLRRAGIGTALVSSSRNAGAVLKAADLTGLFDAVVDGNDASRLGLKGKPAPDIFLHAARELQAAPDRVMVIEDAISGVAAGKAGHFGLVIGIDRRNDPDALAGAGADLVVQDMTSVGLAQRGASAASGQARIRNALECFPEIRAKLERRRASVFLDYDGTLTPIVARPDLALLSAEMRTILRRLARLCTVAIISGRDLADVRERVGLPDLIYAGSHGLDIEGPGDLRIQHKEGATFLAAVSKAAREVSTAIAHIPGALVEPKRMAVAVHYRQVAQADIPKIETAVDAVLSAAPELRKTLGKKVFELRPRLDWDKGRALLWVMDAVAHGNADVVPFYFGDDATDEDAFQAIGNNGVTVYVGCLHPKTAARYGLCSPAQVALFLKRLIELMEHERGA